MAFKHVLLCALVTLLVTYVAFHDKLPHGDSVSLQSRKGLTDSHLTDTTPVLGNTTGAPQDVSVETVEEGVGFSAETQEDSEEVDQEKAVREMEETSAVGDTGSQVIVPEPEFTASPFLYQIQQNNAEAASKEKTIQSCIAENGCGTPE